MGNERFAQAVTAPTIGIWHPGSSSNHGDRAIQLASIDLIFDSYPEARIVQFVHDITAARDIYADEGRNILRRFGLGGSSAFMNGIKGLDLLLWGGGSLVQQSSLFYFPYHLAAAVIAKQRRIPVVCFGSGVEPLRSKVLRALARYAFDQVFTDALVRGPRSKALLSAYGVRKSIRVASDQAICLRPGSPETARRLIAAVFPPGGQRETVSVSVKTSFLYRGGLLPVSLELPTPARSRRQHLRVEFELAFAKLVQHIVDNTGAQVLLVPMYPAQGDARASNRVMTLARRATRVAVLDPLPNSRDLKGILGAVSAHVGVRLHSCILATSMLTPSIGVEYMLKGREYFEMLGMEELLIAEGNVSTNHLIALFDKMWTARDAIRERLRQRIPELQLGVSVQVHDMLNTALSGL